MVRIQFNATSMRKIGKILSYLGFMYCEKCGRKLVYWYTHGYYNERVYKCPHCDKRLK